MNINKVKEIGLVLLLFAIIFFLGQWNLLMVTNDGNILNDIPILIHTTLITAIIIAIFFERIEEVRGEGSKEQQEKNEKKVFLYNSIAKKIAILLFLYEAVVVVLAYFRNNGI